MATIRKRSGRDGKPNYHVQIRLKGFSPETASFDRLTDAKTWAANTESDMRTGRHFGQSKRHTFGELVDEYERQSAQQLRSYRDHKRQLDYWRNAFGSDLLSSITSSRISKERDILLAGNTLNFTEPPSGDKVKDSQRSRSTRTGATVNRYLAALSSCLSYGVGTEWLERNPCERIKKSKESGGRVRFLSDDERTRLLDACRPHDDLYLGVVLSLTTGARQSEILGVRWGQIDFQRQIIQLEQTKNGDRRALPLVGEAFALLQARAKVRNIADDRVFPPTSRAKKSERLDLRAPWLSALKKAGIQDFHWHDLRHTAASYLAMSGVSLVEIAKVLGHRTLAMVARYSHLSDGHIVATGEKLAARLGVGA